MADALARFPFVDDFSQVVAGDVSYVTLRALRCALEPAIDEMVLSGTGDDVVARKVFPAVLYAFAARARIDVAFAYEHEATMPWEYSRAEVVLAMQLEWRTMVERDQISFSKCTDAVIALLAPVVGTAWYSHSVDSVMTAADLLVTYRTLVSDVQVVPVGSVLLAGDSGKLLSELDPVSLNKPVLPVDVYRSMIESGKCTRAFLDALSPDDLLDVAQAPWVWLLVMVGQASQGYCYQGFYHPQDRYMACQQLGRDPLFDYVVEHWREKYAGDQDWTDLQAEVQVEHQRCHLRSPGRIPDDYRGFLGKAIGGDADEPDYFARALVDEFLSKHRRRDSAQEVAVPPVDKHFGSLTLKDSPPKARTGFDAVSAAHYALVGEAVSPQLVSQGFSRGVGGDSLTIVGEREERRLVELYERLDSGANIPESHYDRARVRFSLGKRRPALDAFSGGQVYHVFSGFQADDGGAGMGVWAQDRQWWVPGWTSYVAEFKPGASYTLSFAAPESCADIRMDCSGNGDLYLGQCSLPVSDTVLWFSDSIRFELRVRVRTTLRISVPDSGSALAIGAALRRYMYLPGYAIAARRFSVVQNREAQLVRLQRERNTVVHAGCQLYSGVVSLSDGRHRLRVSGLVSSQPVKLLVKADPVEALTYLGVCGIRIEPRARDYASVLFDLRDGDVSVALRYAAVVQFSVLQVVNIKEFDLTVKSRRPSSTVA